MVCDRCGRRRRSESRNEASHAVWLNGAAIEEVKPSTSTSAGHSVVTFEIARHWFGTFSALNSLISLVSAVGIEPTTL